MKRPTRRKDSSLTRKRALVRSLIEQVGMGSPALRPTNRVTAPLDNIEYLWPEDAMTERAETQDVEVPSNIIPFPDLRRK
jgi:hypothetical protein